MSTLPSISTTRSTAAIQGGTDHDGPDITLIIIVAIVVGGLIICVIVIGFVVHSRQKPRADRTEVAMTPMPVAASNYDLLDNTSKYENRANDTQDSNNNAYSDVQEITSASAGGAVGEDTKHHEPFARYDSLPDDNSMLHGNSQL